MKLNLLVWAGMALTVTASAKSPEFTPDKHLMVGNVYVIEAEKMNLTACEIVTIDSLNGNKAVKLLDTTASGSFEIKLTKGAYMANVLIKALNADNDGFYIIGNNFPSRSFPNKLNEFRYAVKTLTFVAEKDGVQTIKFASNWPNQKPGEFGMFIDKIEIVQVENSTEIVTKWQN